MPRIAVDSGPSGKLVKVTSGQTFARCRALLVGTAGTGTLVDATGTTLTDVPLQQGYNPLEVTKVTFGTVNDVWALY
ncbi:hypothetical protein [Bradyrhizobium paxllaeri]|uniref:hypothetical protein n=1 Tax=Bradyrhizobium paxllaeri TaxID=190148 RepID=UPI0011479C80|nr:hypothetical protein [Bradyrhizobium paxllaeri]